MEVALTFGSVGDIIQLCQLAIRLRRAIGAGCDAVGESAREYQELREELDTLVRILMQVVATYEQYENSPYLEGLDDVAKNVVEQCFGYIKDALEHFQRRYHTSLHPGGSGNRIRDVFKKVEWTREHDRIKVLRGKLRDGIQRLSLIGNLVAEKTATVDHETMLARIDHVQDIVTQHSHDQTKILNLLKTEREASKHQTKKLEDIKRKLAAQTEQLEAQSMQLDETKQQLVQQNAASWSLFSVAKDALSGILEVKSMLVQVSRDVVNLNAVATNASVGVALDPTKDMPVMLGDALGRQIPIPTVWIDTIQWDTLSLLLRDQFADQNGAEMVKNGAYVLEESVSGKDLDRSKPLHKNLRRGMRISMSMVFDNHKWETSTSCPRCHSETVVQRGVTIYCYTAGCGMWWRQDRATRATGSLRTAHSMARSPATSVVWPLSLSYEEKNPVEPADFQRVRLRQNVPHSKSRWHCRSCKTAATNCQAIRLIHEYVSIPEESTDFEMGSKIIEQSASRIQEVGNEDTIPDFRMWQASNDAFFASHDVEWVPTQKPVESDVDWVAYQDA